MLSTSCNFVKLLTGGIQLYSCDVIYDQQSGQRHFVCVCEHFLHANYWGLDLIACYAKDVS